MNVRPYLVLWFALAFFLVLVGWGFYHKLTAPPDAPAPTTAQAPLVERLREERQRRLAERESAAPTVPTTAPAATTTPTTQP